MKECNKLWMYLLIAGICEIIWAVSLGYSEGFTIPWYAAAVVIFLSISIYLLSKAINGGLPVGTAYAVWVGIGSVGTMAVSIILSNEPAAPLNMLFVGAIIIGIIGLQVTCGAKAQD